MDSDALAPQNAPQPDNDGIKVSSLHITQDEAPTPDVWAEGEATCSCGTIRLHMIAGTCAMQCPSCHEWVEVSA